LENAYCLPKSRLKVPDDKLTVGAVSLHPVSQVPISDI
jgi:hypothetical protein